MGISPGRMAVWESVRGEWEYGNRCEKNGSVGISPGSNVISPGVYVYVVCVPGFAGNYFKLQYCS